MSNNKMSNNFTNTDSSLSYSGEMPSAPVASGGSESGLTPRVISISIDKEKQVFPDSSYISPKITSKPPKDPPPIKRSYSILKSYCNDDKVFPDSSYISPIASSKTLQEPPPLKRCRAIALDFSEEKIVLKKKKSKSVEEEDGNTLEYADDEDDDKNNKFKYKIKIPSDFDPDIPKCVINFLRNLNKRDFNFIMDRGYIVKAGDLHDKRIKKVLLELRNYHGIVVSKKK